MPEVPGARVLVPGEASGEVLALDEPLSFWGGLDPETGTLYVASQTTLTVFAVNAAGDRSAARGDLARAADHALVRGDLRNAALAYLDAAWIAQEQRNAKQVWELGHRAELLAESPLLGSADRGEILQRIKRPVLAMRMPTP